MAVWRVRGWVNPVRNPNLDGAGKDGPYFAAWISKHGVLGVHVFSECRWYMLLATVWKVDRQAAPQKKVV